MRFLYTKSTRRCLGCARGFGSRGLNYHKKVSEILPIGTIAVESQKGHYWRLHKGSRLQKYLYI